MSRFWLIGSLAGSMLLLSACGNPDVSSGGKLTFSFARQPIDGPCPEEAIENPAPPDLDRLEILLTNAEGEEHHTASVRLFGEQAPEIGGIEEGQDLNLDVVGYIGGVAMWSGSASGVSIRSGKDTTASVFMTRIGDISCTQRPLRIARAFLAASPMGNGKFLLAGGIESIVEDDCGEGCDSMHASAAVDIFDPGSGTIYPTQRMNTPRALATATMLQDGNVLVVGGATRVTVDSNTTEGLPLQVNPDDVVDTFEVYLHDKKKWIEKPLPRGMIFHSATLLEDGRVLLAGGGTELNIDTASNKAYVFDPAGESIGDIPDDVWNMSTPRIGHAAVLTPSGSVLIIGGAIIPNADITEEFTPSESGGNFAGKNFAGSLANFFFHSASLIPLRPDEILVAGGSFFDRESSLLEPSANNARILSQISSPEIQSVDGPAMSEPRLMNNMVTTANDYLVMTGGFTDLMLTPGQTLDAFEPSGEMKSDMTSLSVARAGHAVIDVTGGRVLMAGGIGPEDLLRSAELFTP